MFTLIFVLNLCDAVSAALPGDATLRLCEHDTSLHEGSCESLSTSASSTPATVGSAADCKLAQVDRHRAITFFIMRHAQGEHNVHSIDIPDASLTPLGFRQATSAGRKVRELFSTPATTTTTDRCASTIHGPVDLIVSSPLRRTIQTALNAFPVASLHDQSVVRRNKILLLPELQELHDKPCDIGVEVSDMSEQYFTAEEMQLLNTTLVKPGWYVKGPAHDDEVRAAARGAALQQRLVDLLLRPENANVSRVVLVVHHGIMRHWLWGGSSHPLRHAGVSRCVMLLNNTRDYPDLTNDHRPECGDAIVLPDVVTE